MKILYINTSGEIAKIGLITESQANFVKFKAQRRLSDVLLGKVQKLLLKNKLNIKGLDALAVFKGPGSFTGLRIGIATANAFGFVLNIPIIEISESDKKDLVKNIIQKFKSKKFKKVIVPFYSVRNPMWKNIGSRQKSLISNGVYSKPPHITKPRNR